MTTTGKRFRYDGLIYEIERRLFACRKHADTDIDQKASDCWRGMAIKRIGF